MAEEVLGLPAARAVRRRCFDLFPGSLGMVRNICGPSCWVVQAIRHDQAVRAFCMDLCVAGGEQHPFTLGFLVDASGDFLVLVLRERMPRGSSPVARLGVAPEAGQASAAHVASLTHQQRQVLQLSMSGAISAEVARRLVVAHATARNQAGLATASTGLPTATPWSRSVNEP